MIINFYNCPLLYDWNSYLNIVSEASGSSVQCGGLQAFQRVLALSSGTGPESRMFEQSRHAFVTSLPFVAGTLLSRTQFSFF